MLKEFLKIIKTTDFINETMFGDEENYDDMLDLRDEEEFEQEWIETDNAVNNLELIEDVEEKIEKIAEVLFIRTMKVAENDELAGAVSDDFTLILTAIYSNYEDKWLSSLLNSYANNAFPYTELKPTTKKLKEIFTEIIEGKA